MRSSLVRSRWAAIGAAVAVALGGGGVLVAGAVAPPVNPVTITITPCRLMDTRPGAVNGGPRSTPLGPGETYTAAVTGTNGNCTIPSTALAIVANVTVTDATSGSFLTVFPSDASLPNASTLNWAAGQTIANQATVRLGTDGAIKLYNRLGSVNVIIDITGYLTPANLSNYYTKAQVDAANATRDSTVAALQATVSSLQDDTYTKAQVDAWGAVASACKGYPHIWVDWHGCTLDGATLHGMELMGANLSGAYLNGADLSSAGLTAVNFSGAQMEFALLTSANLSSANMTGADMYGVNFTGASLTNATLTGAVLTSANLSGVTWSNTTCPDGTNSNNDGNTCIGHL